jgi:NADH-quinone oxidoreductase subunit N
MFGLFLSNEISLNDKNTNLFKTMSKLSLLALSYLLVLLFAVEGNSFAFNYTFFVSDFTQCLKIIMVIITMICIHVSTPYFIRIKVDSFEIFIIFLLSLLAGMVVVSSADFIIFYISLETLSLTLYVLASMKPGNLYSIESALKYFLIGSFSSGIMLFGITIICGITGVFSFPELSLYFLTDSFLTNDPDNVNILMSSFVLILVGFLFKLGVFPFHMWVPDVYEGIPVPVAFFFSTVPKTVIFAILCKILKTFGVVFFSQAFQGIFLILGFLSLFFGAMYTYKASKIKRLLAYSSIANMGYIFLALGINGDKAFTTALFFLFTYLLVSVTVWTGLIVLATLYPGYITELNQLEVLENLDEGLSKYITFSLFSLSGIPPLAGFFSKYLIYQNLIASSQPLLAILVGILSVYASFAYIRIIKTIHFDKIKVNPRLKKSRGNIPTSFYYLMGIFLVTNIIYFFVFNDILFLIEYLSRSI